MSSLRLTSERSTFTESLGIREESGFQNVIAIQGDVQDLANYRSAFDRVFVERTLIHVPDIKRAVRELLGALKPGGKLVLVEPDFTTVSFNSEMPEVTSKIVGMRAKQIRNPTAGALLVSLLRAEGAVVEEVIERPLVHSHATSSLLDLNDIHALAVSASRPGAEEKTLAENGLTAPEVLDWLAEQGRLASKGAFHSVTKMHLVSATKK